MAGWGWKIYSKINKRGGDDYSVLESREKSVESCKNESILNPTRKE